jgi:hypothetical protein
VEAESNYRFLADRTIPPLHRFSPLFPSATKVFGEHHENFATVANLDESVLVDVSPYESHRGTCQNGDYIPLIVFRQNSSAPSFQLENASHESSRSFQNESERMQPGQNWMQEIFHLEKRFYS